MSKGKNFSGNNLGQRKKSDFYQTHYSITRQFLDRESFRLDKSVLEPACGDNAITKILNEYDFKYITSYDIEVDFFTETRSHSYIITNPPYSLAQEFILKAKSIATDKIAFLLPLSYLHGKKRYDVIYSDSVFPLARVYVFTRYPMLGDPIREDGKYRTGMMVYAWFVWDVSHQGDPAIKWIDNNEYVIRGAPGKSS